MDTLTRDTAKSYLWNQVAVVLDGLSLAAASALVGRLAGREALGTLSWVLSTVGLVSLVAALGFKEGAAIIVQRAGSDEERLRGLFATYARVRAFASFAAAAAVYLTTVRDAGPAVAVAAAAYVFALLFSTLLASFDVATFRTSAVAAGKTVSTILGLGIAAAGAWMGSVAVVFAGLAVGAAAGGVLYFLPLKSLARGPRKPFPLATAIELPLAMWLIGIFNFLIGAQGAPRIVKHAGFSEGQIAVLSVGLTVAFISNRALMGGFANVILAAFSRAAGRERDVLARMHSLYMRATAVMSVPAIFAAIVYAPYLAAIWLKGDVSEAALAARVFATWLLLGRLAGGGAHSTALYAVGLHRAGFAVRAVFAVLAVVATYGAAVRYGPVGAAMASGGAGFFVIVAEYLVLYRARRIALPWRPMVRLALGCGAVSLAVWAAVRGAGLATAVSSAPVYALALVVVTILARPLGAGEASELVGRGLASRFIRLFEAKAPQEQ